MLLQALALQRARNCVKDVKLVEDRLVRNKMAADIEWWPSEARARRFVSTAQRG